MEIGHLVISLPAFRIVPTLCMGMQYVTLLRHGTQERPSMNSHAERGNLSLYPSN